MSNPGEQNYSDLQKMLIHFSQQNLLVQSQVYGYH